MTTVYCWFCPAHPPHRWSPYENTPGEGENLCRGWHGRPNEYSPDADNRELPDDANYTTAWHDLNAPTWDMFLPKRINNALEIGSYEGRSANWLLSNRDVGHLTCVDPFANNDDPCSVGDYSARFDRNVVEQFPGKVTKVCGYSPHAVPDGEYDFIYVDGEHSYAQTVLDLERAWPMLTDDGLMIVDDIGFWVERFAPLQAVEDFFRNKPHELVFDGYQRGYRKCSSK